MSVIVNCLFCNKEFSTLKCRIRANRGKFCSRKCYNIHQKSTISDSERFWTNIEKTESCWLWKAGLNAQGYGQIKGAFHWRHTHPEKVKKGINHYKAKLNEDDIRTIRKLSATTSQRKIAKLFNVRHITIGRILRNEAWTHIK